MESKTYWESLSQIEKIILCRKYGINIYNAGKTYDELSTGMQIYIEKKVSSDGERYKIGTYYS